MGRHARLRVGIDLGGTKIAGIALDANDAIIAQRRVATPRENYTATLDAIARMVDELTATAPLDFTVGVGMPGSLAPGSGTVQNANSTWLNARPFQADLEARLSRTVKCANDANCFILSEAYDGAARGAGSAFGVILGTGCGGGLLIADTLVNGSRNIGGEWGHNPLPWPSGEERPGPRCWCGRQGCLETWLSGPAIAADHTRRTGERLTTQSIAKRAQQGDDAATATMERHLSRLARGLAHVVNMVDPEVIVLGGGLSGLDHLYRELPACIAPYIFADDRSVDVRPPRWGDASGVRGAARLYTYGK